MAWLPEWLAGLEAQDESMAQSLEEARSDRARAVLGLRSLGAESALRQALEGPLAGLLAEARAQLDPRLFLLEFVECWSAAGGSPSSRLLGQLEVEFYYQALLPHADYVRRQIIERGLAPGAGVEDAAAIVWKSAFRYADSYRPSRHGPRGWLRQIARRSAVQQLQRRGREQRSLESLARERARVPQPGPVESLCSLEWRQQLERVLQPLQPEVRRLVRGLIEGTRYGELAADLDCTHGAVEKRVLRLRPKLLAMLQRAGIDLPESP